jgi:hypothetical protein
MLARATAAWSETGSARPLFERSAVALAGQGWVERRCRTCGRAFLATTMRNDCGSRGCGSVRPRAGNRTEMRAPGTLWAAVRPALADAGFFERRLDDLVCTVGEPIFIIAALQTLDDVMYRGAALPTQPSFAAQPSIRMRYVDEVGDVEGFGTSFVNIATHEFDITPARFDAHLALWLGILNQLGIARSELTLIEETVPFVAGPYRGWYLLLNWRGIEIGEAIRIDRARTADGRELALLEFSFGLERLLWAVNGTAAYHRNIGPPLARILDSPVLVDAARTATLMAMAGITPGARGPGGRLRMMVARLDRALGTAALAPLVRHCHAEWRPFLTPQREPDAALDVIARELARQRTLALARRIGCKEHIAAAAGTPEALAERLLAAGNGVDRWCGAHG